MKRFILIALSLAISGCSEDPDKVSGWEHSYGALYAAALSNDGRLALVSSAAHGASLWDLQKNARLFDWNHNDSDDNAISVVAFSPNGSHALTADSRTFVVWSTATGKALGYWSVDSNINAAALSSDARFVLLGLSDGRAVHINQSSQRRLEVIAHQGERVDSVALSADGSIALTGGSDSRAMLWRTSNGQELHAFEHSAHVNIVAFDASEERIFSADERGAAYVWNTDSGNRLATLDLGQRRKVVSAAQFSNSGSRIVLGFPGRDVAVWDSSNGRQLSAWRTATRRKGWVPQGSTVYAVGFDDQTATVLAESSNGLGQAWRAAAL